MNDKPTNERLVSVLIPCYNHELFLKDCLDSIINQKYQRIELLICDDCSTDNSRNVIYEYMERLKERFVNFTFIVNKTNQGVTKSLNKLLLLAQGEYIKPLASDDFLHEDYIYSCIEAFIYNTNCSVVVTNGYKIEQESTRKEMKVMAPFYASKPCFDVKTMFREIYLDNFIFAPGAMIKSSVYNELGIYDEDSAVEDWEFWLRLTKEKNIEFEYLESPLVYYRINTSSITSLKGEHVLEKRKRVFYSEMYIIDKYGKEFSLLFYLERKYTRICQEREILNSIDAKDIEGWIEKELNKSLMLKWMDIFVRIKNRYRIH